MDRQKIHSEREIVSPPTFYSIFVPTTAVYSAADVLLLFLLDPRRGERGGKDG